MLINVIVTLLSLIVEVVGKYGVKSIQVKSHNLNAIYYLPGASLSILVFISEKYYIYLVFKKSIVLYSTIGFLNTKNITEI